MNDRTIRNLANLQRSASTARVLNLLNVYNQYRHDPDWAARPLFRSPALNRAMIIKHRLRRDELDSFPDRRQIATKIVIPIDASDLKIGGRFIFVGQRGFNPMMKEAFGLSPEHRDMTTLGLLDRLPSLDPFLLREQLKRAGLDLAPCYLSISESDLEQMSLFVQGEVQALVSLIMGSGPGANGSTRRLAGKILSNDPQDRMESLRLALRLGTDEYDEGMFCWKGFLYYKWMLNTLELEIAAVADAVGSVKPVGKVDRGAKEYLDRGRSVLRARIQKTVQEATSTLNFYDNAYAGLTVAGQPLVFREFLLDAPRLFTRLGEQLGAIQHVVSFWRFRFNARASMLSPEELIDIFMDFETGLAERDQGQGQAVLAA